MGPHLTCVLIKGKFGQMYTEKEDDMKAHREKMAIDKPRRHACVDPSLAISEGSNPAATLILDFQT